MTESYFNTTEYLDYLLKNFEIDDLGKKEDYCTKVNMDIAYNYIDMLNINSSDHVLEIGCGLGRVLKFTKRKFKCQISGTDISTNAIELAKQRLLGEYEFLESRAVEDLNFPSNSFSHIICWAVFDLTNQGLSIVKMLNTLKEGGKILLTGKNDQFELNDEEALIAEIKSREKCIPNHYTDFKMLRTIIEENGAKIIFNQFFKYRGDFAKGNYVTDLPEKFYEYCLIIQKMSNTHQNIFTIASEFSKTWRNKYEG